METDGLALPKGYQALIRAVFIRAVEDYVATPLRRDNASQAVESRSRERERIIAREWFLAAPNDDWPFNVHNVCAALGWSIRQVQGSIREREKGPEPCEQKNDQTSPTTT